MIYLEKSQPAPSILEKEKTKKSGDYKAGDILERIKNDFKNKCYICEYKEPESINVEHFYPHEGDLELKFDWNNLFFACSHCNNIKLNNYKNILNCTIKDDQVETSFKYNFLPFPFENVEIEPINNDNKALETSKLLNNVYNGTTTLKRIESSNLKKKLLREIQNFQGALLEYFEDTNDNEDREYYYRRIKSHLNKASNFTAFKRFIVRENDVLADHFSHLLQ